MGGHPYSNQTAPNYWSTPQRRKGESLKDYSDRLAVYDANYSAPKLVEAAVPKVKPRYRVKAWKPLQQP